MDDQRRVRFGRYEILAELGRGAMGVVYKARDPKINRVVAIKTVSLEGQPPEEEREYRERFFREAEAAGRLSHPGIVTIYDVGEEPETRAPYIVMEFVGGESLEKFLSHEDRKMPPDPALQLTLELAEALDCAHGQGVVHRDLKPANILLTEDGHAKIADFGIAKLNLANHTLAGRVLGTPAYMSPEQLNGDTVDGRSDLFSLGVVLYTVLTGYRPFQGNSALTVSFKVVNREPVPATVLNTGLPHGLDYIIGRAMAKDPAQRYQRGMEMALDIQELREGREPWSKTKQPGSAPGAEATRTRARSRAAGQMIVADQPRFSLLALPLGRDAAEKLLEKMRKRSFVAAALLVVGLLILGIRLGDSVWARRKEVRNPTRTKTVGSKTVGSLTVGSLPVTGELGPVKTAAPPVVIAPVPVVTPIVNKPSKPVQAARTHPRIVKVLAAGASTTSPSPAMLDVEVEHTFAEAHMSIWVDDRLTYTHLLEGTDKKHLVVFHHVQGQEFHAMQIPSGKHRLRVQVTSGESASDKNGAVTGEFASGKESLLRITFNKHGEMNLSLQ